MAANPVRSFVTVLMNLLVLLAVLVTVTIIIQFFGALASQTWGRAIVTLLGGLSTLPLGIEAVKTPYGGVFDADAALTVVGLLLIEWALSALRTRA